MIYQHTDVVELSNNGAGSNECTNRCYSLKITGTGDCGYVEPSPLSSDEQHGHDSYEHRYQSKYQIIHVECDEYREGNDKQRADRFQSESHVNWAIARSTHVARAASVVFLFILIVVISLAVDVLMLQAFLNILTLEIKRIVETSKTS